eukprot:s580_g5.t1
MLEIAMKTWQMLGQSRRLEFQMKTVRTWMLMMWENISRVWMLHYSLLEIKYLASLLIWIGTLEANPCSLVRAVDDGKRSALNLCYTINLKLELDDVDTPAALIAAVADSLQTGEVRFDMPDNTSCSVPVHPLVSSDAWCGRTLDLSRAYTQLALDKLRDSSVWSDISLRTSGVSFGAMFCLLVLLRRYTVSIECPDRCTI